MTNYFCCLRKWIYFSWNDTCWDGCHAHNFNYELQPPIPMHLSVFLPIQLMWNVLQGPHSAISSLFRALRLLHLRGMEPNWEATFHYPSIALDKCFVGKLGDAFLFSFVLDQWMFDMQHKHIKEHILNSFQVDSFATGRARIDRNGAFSFPNEIWSMLARFLFHYMRRYKAFRCFGGNFYLEMTFLNKINTSLKK